MQKRKEVLKFLKEQLEQKRAFVIIGLKDQEVTSKISLNGFAKKYHSSIRHLGFGCFLGKTESGEFSFDGGGAMIHPKLESGESYISYSSIDGTKEVIQDLNYPFDEVIQAIQQELA